MSSLICLIPSGSSPFVGSSRTNTSGFDNKAAASASLCFIPKEYELKGESFLLIKSTLVSTSSIRDSSIPFIKLLISRFLYPDNSG